MRKVGVDYLKPGMNVARTVYSSEGYVLLNVGMILKERYIEQLKSFNIPAIYVEDNLAPDVEVEDVISEQTRMQAVRTVKEVFRNMNLRVNSGHSLVLEEEKLAGAVQDIIKDLLNSKNLVVNLVDIRATDSYTFGHSVNVCVLSVLTGIALKLTQKQLTYLGMGALMHDIGKIMVPAEILNKPGTLTAPEYAVIQRHSEFGFNILSKQREMNSLAAKIAIQHHERYDGSGYPQGLKDQEIHLFARIVGMVDVYDALTADRIYRKGYLPHEAYEFLAGAGGSLFDYELVKEFLSYIAAYPAGTIVKLNTGEIGVVIDTPQGLTTRPVVRVLFDEGHILEEPYEIKLAEKMRVLVTEVITGEGLDLVMQSVKYAG